jgi:acyl-CoA synthetase (AMP-forming)/AMP-acid ligase II
MSTVQIHGVAPPKDGSVTLPEAVDFHVKHNPTLPIYVFMEDGASKITEVSYLEFGRACYRVAHHLRAGRRGPEREVVAVLALSDSLLYQTTVLGTMKAGLIVRTISLFFLCTIVSYSCSHTQCLPETPPRRRLSY